jgi:hypothetical protein
VTANLGSDSPAHDDNDSQQVTDTAEQADAETQPVVDPHSDSEDPQTTITKKEDSGHEEDMAKPEASATDALDAVSGNAEVEAQIEQQDDAKPAETEAGGTASVQDSAIAEAAENHAEAGLNETTANEDTSEPAAALLPTAAIPQGEELEPTDSVGVAALSEQGPEPTTAGSADPPKEQPSGTLIFFFCLLGVIAQYPAPSSIVRCMCRIELARPRQTLCRRKADWTP